MNPLMGQVLGYLGVFIFCIIFINLITSGFALKYISIRMSAGKKVLVIVHATTHTYYKKGQIKNNMLTFKNLNGEKCHQSVSKEHIGRLMSVQYIEIDENTGAIRKPDFTVVQSYDLGKFDIYLQKAILLAELRLSKKDWLILIVSIISIVLCIYIAFQTRKIGQEVVEVHKLLYNLTMQPVVL